MEINAEDILYKIIHDGLAQAFLDRLKHSYHSPFDELLVTTVRKHQASLMKMLDDSIESCIADPKFREHVMTESRAKLAKILVQRFGGELERQVNALKSDPTTRARIVMAIEKIVAEKVDPTAVIPQSS